MAFFGFVCTSPTPPGIAELGAYGAARMATHGIRSEPGESGTCWAPEILRSSGALVALVGNPYLRGTPFGRSRQELGEHLVNAFRNSGVAALAGLAGRFSIAIIDATNRRALLAVDPMGIERLCFAEGAGQLVFGESATDVADCPGIRAPVDRQSVFNYLLLHMVPAPGTVFAGVRKLRPGTCALLEAGRVTVSRYWRPAFEERETGDFAALSSRLHETLRAATARTNPDGETGAFLSGGLDSSTVAGFLSKVGPQPARTFSIGFGYVDYDELDYARLAAAHFGCEGREYVIKGDDIADSFALIARTYDEPFGNSSALPVYYCAKLARTHGVTHLLAGDGGDELFGGNSRYVEQRVFEHYRKAPAWLRASILEPLAAHWPRPLRFWIARKFCNYVNMAKVPLPARLESWNLIHRLGTAAFLHPDYLHSMDADAPFRDMQEVWNSTPGNSVLNKMLWYDWQYTLADNDLRKVETMGRLAGVRVSYPMLDDDVVGLSMHIPPGLKMADSRLRSFYKDAMKGFLPAEIIDKKKHGFGLPFGLWLQSSPRLATMVRDNLADLRKRHIVHPGLIDRLMNLHEREDARYYGVFVWVLAMLEQWMQEHRRSVT